jgi:hypothetical protein
MIPLREAQGALPTVRPCIFSRYRHCAISTAGERQSMSSKLRRHLFFLDDKKISIKFTFPSCFFVQSGYIMSQMIKIEHLMIIKNHLKT